MWLELLLLGVLVLVVAVMRDRKPSNMPPGPTEIPFIGTLTLYETTEQFETLRKQYGDIYSIRIGVVRTVVLNKYKQAKEAMASVDLVDRPHFFRVFSLDPEEEGGLVSSNGMQWIHDRRFVLRNMRDLGMGRSYLEVAIHQEAEALIQDLRSLQGKPTLYPRSFRTAVLNVVWQMVAGRRYDLRSKEVERIFSVNEKFRNASMYVIMEGFLPALKYVPELIKVKLFNTNILQEFRDEMKRIIHEVIEEHEKDLDEDKHDLISEYLSEMKKQDSTHSAFSYEDLYQVVSDLFAAGSDTVTNMLHWVVFYMVKYPEIKKKCQKEIDAVAGNQLVSITQKPELPYMEAFVMEALRHSSMVLQNVQRSAVRDLHLHGYFIPKGTAVTVSNYYVHRDPEIWTHPDEFSPDRFIDETGIFNTKNFHFFMFGSGRRQCLGEALARMELFLFTAAIMQNFDIELPPGAQLDERVLDSVFIRIPADQPLIFRERMLPA